MASQITDRCLIIIAGNLLPYDKLGSSFQFGTRLFPSEKCNLATLVFNTLRNDVQLFSQISRESTQVPEENCKEAIVSVRLRSVGIRCWFVSDPKKIDRFLRFSVYPLGSWKLKKATKLIDQETLRRPEFIADLKGVANFELHSSSVNDLIEGLISHIENFH
jgi:hypothetical protein